MTLGKFTLATCLLTAPAWAQYSKADMTKLAMDRLDTATHTLKLARIKSLGSNRFLKRNASIWARLKMYTGRAPGTVLQRRRLRIR